MSSTEDQELNDLFAHPTKPLEEDVLAELQSIMRLHAIPPQELFYKWESYSMKIGNDLKLNIDTARALKKDVQESIERELRTKAHPKNTDRRIGSTPKQNVKSDDIFGMLDGMAPATPRPSSINKHNSTSTKRKLGPHETPSISRLKLEAGSSPLSASTPISTNTQTQSSSFEDRPNPGQIIEVLNAHLEEPEPPIAPFPASRIKVVANTDMKKFSYKPMGMKQSEASEILDDRIDEFMQLIQTHHKLEDSEFGSAASKSVNEVIAVGRIASDSADGKLNAAALVIEMSRRMGAGLRTPLKLDKLRGGYQFFPGQIVAVRGTNVSGKEFIATEILDVPMLPVAASEPSQITIHTQRMLSTPDSDAMETDTPPQPLNIMIASGPYTSDDNLDFLPLKTLCLEAADNYADALFLTGPFLDIDHPLISSGAFTLPPPHDPDTTTLTTVFRALISPHLQSLHNANPNITILLIPSTRDAISTHISYPQEPFPRPGLGLPKSVRVVANPMTFSFNEILAGISSPDILYALRDQELVSDQSANGGLLSRLPKYLIDQRHYYPLYPPVDRERLPRTGTKEGVAAGVALDVGYAKLGEILNIRPDLMVVPSSLPGFAKVVESTLVINPGFLSKRKAAGTYAKMSVYPLNLTEEEKRAGGFVAHRLYDRARVEIVRI